MGVGHLFLAQNLEQVAPPNNDDLEASINCKDFHKEAEFLLKKTIKFEVDEEIISKTAEALKLSFISNMKEHGMPKFKGIKRAFQREKISDDHYIITETCHYPDGSKSKEKLNTYRINNEWKVLGLEE